MPNSPLGPGTLTTTHPSAVTLGAPEVTHFLQSLLQLQNKPKHRPTSFACLGDQSQRKRSVAFFLKTRLLKWGAETEGKRDKVPCVPRAFWMSQGRAGGSANGAVCCGDFGGLGPRPPPLILGTECLSMAQIVPFSDSRLPYHAWVRERWLGTSPYANSPLSPQAQARRPAPRKR